MRAKVFERAAPNRGWEKVLREWDQKCEDIKTVQRLEAASQQQLDSNARSMLSHILACYTFDEKPDRDREVQQDLDLAGEIARVADKLELWAGQNPLRAPPPLDGIAASLRVCADEIRPIEALRGKSVGRPDREEDDALILDLAILFRQIGGEVTVSPNDNGAFTMFLREIWEMLPRHLSPSSQLTFLKRAQSLRPNMSRQADIRHIDGFAPINLVKLELARLVPRTHAEPLDRNDARDTFVPNGDVIEL